jgi:hypothetical protein
MVELPVAFLDRLRALEGAYLRETDPVRQSGFGAAAPSGGASEHRSVAGGGPVPPGFDRRQETVSGHLLWARGHRSPATGTLLDIGVVALWIVTVVPDRR